MSGFITCNKSEISNYNSEMNAPHNLYIHVPYCASKCNYCAFHSVACVAPDWDKYYEQIISGINYWCSQLGRVQIPTIFFGGGTPSLMPMGIFAKIINAIRENFDVSSDAEITLESNPGTLDKNKLSEFVSNGVNRLSIGVQSFNDDELKFLGRKHTVNDALNLIKTAQNMGLRVSADFIYGLPNHTEQTMRELCEQINELNLEHVSLYELTIEPNTPFYKMNLQMPTNDKMATMYETIQKTLRLPRYEVSNYGTPCQHNQNIWDGGAYIGIGDGAAGRVLINGQWYETKNWKSEIKNQKLSVYDRTVEKIITGLRMTIGVKLTDDVKNAINWDYVNLSSIVSHQSDYERLTIKNFLILDTIMVDLIL